jgi:hypothetical protein
MTTYSPTPGPVRRNPMGHVALAIGVVASLISVVIALSQAALVRQADITLINIVSALQTGVNGLLGAGTLLVGIIALLIPGSNRVLAAAGTALGASLLLGVITTLLYGFVVQLSGF